MKILFLRYLHIILILILLSGLNKNAPGQLYINELMSNNVSAYMDPYTFFYSDWIEIYNADTIDIDIRGYFLTDNLTNPTKYPITDTFIVYAGRQTIFWADGGNWWAHTNFKLSSDGEVVALFGPDTQLVDMVKFGPLGLDISYGRQPDGSSNWVYFDKPTPIQSNSFPGYTGQSFTPPPQFSHPGGIYQGSLQVEIFPPSGTEIRFTTDGSVPSESSQLYTGPVAFDYTLIIRARAFEAGKFPSPVVTNTFFISISHSLPVVSLVTSPHHLWDTVTGIYSNSLRDVEVPFNFEFIDTTGSGVVNQLLGLQISGQVAYKLPQKIMNIYARKKYGKNGIEYKFFNTRENNLFTSLILRNGGFPDNSSTMFRDAVMQQFVVNQLDIDYQDYTPVIVYLNGEYWGIYNLREKHSEDYLAANNNADPFNVDLLENYWRQALCGDTVNYNVLLEFLENCEINDPSTIENLKKYIDYDNYLNNQITQIYYANTDWPGNNNRFWRPRAYKGKWRWLLYDVEFGFGQEADYDHNTLAFVTDPVGQNWANPPEATWLFRRMLENDEFRNDFIQRSVLLLKMTFKPDRIVHIIDSLKANVTPEMPNHINRWKDECWVSEWGQPFCGISSMDYWDGEVEVMREFAHKRPEFIYKYTMQQFSLADTVSLSISSKNGKVALTGITLPADSFKCTFFKNIPLQAQAFPNPGYSFAGWSGVSKKGESVISLSLTADTVLVANFLPSGMSLIPPFIDSDLELTSANSPYYAINDVVIDSFASLTIGPGVEIRMNENSCFIVHGRLVTNGTGQSPVYIRANKQAGVKKWGAVCVYNSTDTTILNHTTFENSTNGHDENMFKATVSAYNSNVRMKGVVINDAIQPFFSQFGDYIEITGCKLRSESVCDLINIKYAKFAYIEGCDLLGNEMYDTDGIDLDGLEGAIVRNNNISGFFGVNCDGLDIGENANNILIEKNKIINCFDKGVSVGQASTAIVKNNIFINCTMGIGVKDSGSYAFIDRNTLYGCTNGISCYEKNPGAGGGQANVINTIFAGCTTEDVYADTLSTISVYYSLSNTRQISGNNNIFGSPEFQNTLLYDFSLKPNSPCIDGGDPASPPDEDGTIADIGAVYTTGAPVSPLSDVMINEINYNSPEWADAGDWLELYNNENYPADISGWIFKDNDNSHGFYIPKGCVIPAGGYIVLCNNRAFFNQVHPHIYNILYDFDFGLNNNGEMLRLFDNNMRLVDSVNYSDQPPWPVAADGDGPTLSLISPSLDNGIAASWEQSYILYGTPGETNEYTDIPTSDKEPSKELLLYPNPSNGFIILKGKSPEDNADYTIRDLYGKILLTGKCYVSGNWLIRIDVSHLPEGIYSVNTRTGDTVWHNKFILAK